MSVIEVDLGDEGHPLGKGGMLFLGSNHWLMKRGKASATGSTPAQPEGQPETIAHDKRDIALSMDQNFPQSTEPQSKD